MHTLPNPIILFQVLHNNISKKLLLRLRFVTPAAPAGAQLCLLPLLISSTTPSLQTIQSPCINASITSSLFAVSMPSISLSAVVSPATTPTALTLGFRGVMTIEGGTFARIVILAPRRRSGDVSSIDARIVFDSLNEVFALVLRPEVAFSDLECEYVDRTNFHTSSPCEVRDLAHSYRSYLPTKIQPPPSPLRKSTCHFPITPLGSRSNLHSVVVCSVSTMRVLRMAWDSRFKIGRIRRRRRAGAREVVGEEDFLVERSVLEEGLDVGRRR
jgi:hypothetical protein